MGWGKKSFKVVWRCHQVPCGFLAKGYLPRVSYRSLMIRVIMKWSRGSNSLIKSLSSCWQKRLLACGSFSSYKKNIFSPPLLPWQFVKMCVDFIFIIWFFSEPGAKFNHSYRVSRSVKPRLFTSIIPLLEKYPTFFLRKPGEFQWSALAWGDLEPSYSCVSFFPPFNSQLMDGKQHLSDIVFSALIGFSL